MATAAVETKTPQDHITLHRHRFTADELERMAVANIFTENDRVELIAGEIIEMSPIGAKHVGCVNALVDVLASQAREDALISVQNPIHVSDTMQVQPDIALLNRSTDRRIVPPAADVLLVMEVADSSRDYDRVVKLPVYLAAGIAEFWLIDLVAETIERHSESRDGRYRLVAVGTRGDTLASTVLPALAIPVDTVLGKAESETTNRL